MDRLNVNYKNFVEEREKLGSFIKPGSKTATTLITAAVAAETKSPQSAQITENTLKSLGGGKILGLTDMHGHGLRLEVM